MRAPPSPPISMTLMLQHLITPCGLVNDQECASAGPIQLPNSITLDPTCMATDNSFYARLRNTVAAS